MFYLINLCAMIFCYYIIVGRHCDNLKKIKKFTILAGIHIILFRALANPYNYVDTDGYVAAFETIRDWSFRDAILDINYYTAWGNLFVLINWCVGQFTNNVLWFYATVSVFSLVPIIWCNYKLSKNIVVSLTMFLVYPMMYYMGFGVLRQHLAVGFILLALYYMDNKKISLLIAIIASLCHTSALVFLPFYIFNLLGGVKLNKIWWVFIVVGSSFLIRSMMQYMVVVFERYESIGEAGSSNTLPLIVMGGISILIMTTGTLKDCNNKERSAVLFVLYGVALAIVGVGVHGLGRLTLYNMYVVPIVTTFLFRNPKGRVGAYCFIFAFFLLTAYLIANSNMSYEYVPFWQHVYNPTV